MYSKIKHSCEKAATPRNDCRKEGEDKRGKQKPKFINYTSSIFIFLSTPNILDDSKIPKQ
jgi:hypothetical protein